MGIIISSFFFSLPLLSPFCELSAINLGDFLIAILYVYKCKIELCVHEDPIALK